jgi:hypothetical protein
LAPALSKEVKVPNHTTFKGGNMRYSGQIKKIMLTVPLFTVFMLGGAAPAQADFWLSTSWRDHDRHKQHRSYRKQHGHHDYYHRHHRRPHYGRSVVFLPHRSVTIVIGGGKYYYGEGHYYRRRTHDYEIVAPPVGAVIYSLPSKCRPMVVAGVPYYVDDGVYYRKVPRGYEVVEPPYEEVQYIASNKPQDSFNVNIPNANGGFTTVTVKRSGQGFVGPQGEYYSEFPKVEELRVMYAR